MRKRKTEPDQDCEIAFGPKPFEGDRQFVTALYRGLEILRCFRPGDDALGNQELSQRSGIGPSTVSRITYTLTKLGYLRYDRRTARYRLGVAVLGLGYACLTGLGGGRALAQTRLQEAAERLGGGLQLALSARENLYMTYVACARGAGVMTLQLDIGSRLPLARSAAGHAHLAGQPEPVRERLIARLGEAAAAETAESGAESDWPRVEAAIREAVDEVERRGYTVCLGGWRKEVNAVGVPIRSKSDDGVVYSLTCGGLSHYLPRERLEQEIAPILLDLAGPLSYA